MFLVWAFRIISAGIAFFGTFLVEPKKIFAVVIYLLELSLRFFLIFIFCCLLLPLRFFSGMSCFCFSRVFYEQRGYSFDPNLIQVCCCFWHLDSNLRNVELTSFFFCHLFESPSPFPKVLFRSLGVLWTKLPTKLTSSWNKFVFFLSLIRNRLLFFETGYLH